MDRRVVQEIVVAALGEGGALQPDDPGNLVLVVGGDLEHDGAAHRTAHHHRAFETERSPEIADQAEIDVRGEAVFLQPPFIGRVGTAVKRQVEGEHAEAVGNLGIVQHMPELPAVGAGGMQADQRPALPASS